MKMKNGWSESESRNQEREIQKTLVEFWSTETNVERVYYFNNHKIAKLQIIKFK